MRAQALGEHTTQLTGSAILFPVNCYLVREADGFTLIDTGISTFARPILAAAQRLGTPIVRIALTHAHMDHIGALDALHAALPDAGVILSAREARIIGGDRTLDPGEAQGPIRGGYPAVATRPTQTIQPGDRIGSLEVIAAPGHTPGQAAFLDTRDRLLIAGDALSTYQGIAVAGIARPLFPFLKMGTWDLATAVATARSLRDLRPTWLAVGHGAALRDPAEAMARAIAEAERRLAGAQARAA